MPRWYLEGAPAGKCRRFAAPFSSSGGAGFEPAAFGLRDSWLWSQRWRVPAWYRVYVVQVMSRCERCKRRRKAGMRCCIYVGYTSKTPEERLNSISIRRRTSNEP